MNNQVIHYTCPKCDTQYSVIQKQRDPSPKGIPSPGVSILQMQYQDHGDHTYFLEIDGKEVKSYRIIPHIRSVFDTLLFDNIVVSRIVNTIIKSNGVKEQYTILYITDLSTFKTFFAELTKKYSGTSEKIQIHFEPGFMMIERDRIVLIICTLDLGLEILKKGRNAIDYLRSYEKIRIRSLVVDTSIKDENTLLKKVKKSKIKLDEDLPTIIAFNSSKSKEVPLKLREYFLDKFKIKSLELLNYLDTNGLKSILLQSYYNSLDDPYEAREVYELIHMDQKPSV